MKQKLLLAFWALCISYTISAQTIYTYTGTGNWDDTANWSPSYPGTSVTNPDVIEISSNANITINVNVQSTAEFNVRTNSILTVNTGVALTVSDNESTMYGSVINNGTINVSEFQRFRVRFGGILTNEIGGTVNITKNSGTNGLFELRFGNSKFINKGTVNSAGNINFHVRNTTELLNESTGIFNNSNNSTISIQDFDGLITNNGLINNFNGTARGRITIPQNKLVNNGKIKNDGGRIIIGSQRTLENTQRAILNNFNNGDVSFSFPNDGILDNQGTRVEASALTQGTNAISVVEITNTANVTSEQLTNLAGTINNHAIDGKLEITILDETALNIGDTITIPLTNLTGTFDTVEVTNSTITFSIAYNTDDFVLTVTSNPLSIPDIEEDALFSVFPNPTKGLLDIRSTSADTIDAVKLFSSTGAFLFEVNPRQSKVDLSFLPNGLYIMTLKSTDKTEVHKVLLDK